MSWFDSTLTYRGRGTAVFESPSAVIDGPAAASYDDRGGVTIRLEVERISSADRLPFGLLQILAGEPVRLGQPLEIGSPALRNPCNGLTIATADGAFTARPVSYGASITGHEAGTISFHVLKAAYDQQPAENAVYWVIPVFNYAARLVGRRSRVDDHPLRMYSPKVPANLTGIAHDMALINALDKNRTIVFERNGALAFLEQLADIEERERQLRAGTAPRLITAVLVGDLDEPPPTLDTLHSWIPLDITTLLGVASGVRCAPAWIELRDATARLVQRIHAGFGLPSYHEGRPAIDEFNTALAGRFLTNSLKSPHLGHHWLRVVLKHLVNLGRLGGATLEEHISALSQVFELLVRHENIGPEDLTTRLDTSLQRAVTSTLTTAATAIRAFSSPDPAALTALNRIAARARSAASRERDLGQQIGLLTAKKGLADFEIVNAHFKATPRSDGIPTLQAVVSKYRGTVVHEAFFDFTTEFDLDDVVIIVHHLYDLALRLVLGYLGYDGTYTSPAAPLAGERTLDWVTPATPAGDLGYSRRSLYR